LKKSQKSRFFTLFLPSQKELKKSSAMENLKITQLLRSLSSDEFKKLGKFINSPFHNESKLMITFYKLFKKQYPHFSGAHFTREKIFAVLYPDEKYSDHKMRDRLSEFVRLLERFIVFNSISEDAYGFRMRVVDYCKRKNINSLFEKEISELLKETNKEELKDEFFYKKQYEIKESYWDYRLSRHLAGSADILDDLASEVADIINFFLIKILKAYLSIINGQENINYDYRFTFFEEIMKYLDSEINSYKNVKLVYILYYFFKLFKEDVDISVYYELKKLVEENEQFVDNKYLGVLYVELINYCKYKEEEGDQKFGKEGFELMKHMLKLGLLFESDNTLHIENYTAIAASALRLNELVWAEKFINEYANYLLSEYRENTYMYNMSVLYFVKAKNNPEKKKELLNKSLEYLSGVQCNDFQDKTRVNNHLLVIYYEMEYIEEALSLIDSYRHYLAANTLMLDYQKSRYSQFINFLGRIINLREGSKRINVSKLTEDIKSAPLCENRKWLLLKIDEITQKN
jgi:hypothetical protein